MDCKRIMFETLISWTRKRKMYNGLNVFSMFTHLEQVKAELFSQMNINVITEIGLNIPNLNSSEYFGFHGDSVYIGCDYGCHNSFIHGDDWWIEKAVSLRH